MHLPGPDFLPGRCSVLVFVFEESRVSHTEKEGDRPGWKKRGSKRNRGLVLRVAQKEQGAYERMGRVSVLKDLAKGQTMQIKIL
jgi:hypothetical protein